MQGFFWGAGHTLINEVVGEEKTSKKFIAIRAIVDKIARTVFPIIFGTSIEITSFFYIAKNVIPISILQFIF